MASEQASVEIPMKTILGRSDGGLGLVGERVVIGGWVKSSNEVRKEPVPPPVVADDMPGPKDVKCGTRIPFFRSIMKVLGGSHRPVRKKLESVIQKLPPPPSIAILQVSDGSCVASLQVLVDSSISPPSQVVPTGTWIVAEGILQQLAVQGKHPIELKVEKLMHVGTVDQDKYPLSKKRVPLEILRDFSHYCPQTTTVASVTRIRNALSQTTHNFFMNNGFLYVQVPIITTTDCEGFSEKFQVTTLLDKEIEKVTSMDITTTDCEGFSEKFQVTTLLGKEIEKVTSMDDAGGVSLETIKASINQKNKQVDELKRSESNREALAAALQDLHKTNELASLLEAREKSKFRTSVKMERVDFSEDFFSRQTYLTVSGRLHLESYAHALGNVYSFGPRFQAQKSESKKHVAEMWMIELEMAFSQLEV